MADKRQTFLGVYDQQHKEKVPVLGNKCSLKSAALNEIS